MAIPGVLGAQTDSDFTGDISAFTARFARASVSPRALRELYRWLNTLPKDPTGAEASTQTLGVGIRWLLRGWPTRDPKRAAPRLAVLLEALEASSQWQSAAQQLFASILDSVDAVPLFESGLPNDRGIWEESKDRLARRFLPSLRDESDLGALVLGWFSDRRAVAWLGAITPEDASRVAALLPATGTERLRQGLLDSIALIAARTSALGLSREMRARSPRTGLGDSPFFKLPRVCDALLDGQGTIDACSAQITASRIALGSVLTHLERYGVSVDVVYRIEVIDKSLTRLAQLLLILDKIGEARADAVTSLLHEVALARVQDRSLRDLAGTNIQLLARKVIERAGHTGEHYITVTRGEYWKMLSSAAGGGFLTAFTCAMKYTIVWGHFPLFVEGFLASTNYACSFLLIQLLGFTLATKQPSAIAAALAHALQGSSRTSALDELVTLITRICRSQFIAVVGNVGMVIPAAFAFNVGYQHLTGQPFLDEAAAEYTLHSTNPLETGTVYFAALTGVFLWLSSLGAGWLENWSAYHRLPDAIAQRSPRWFMRWLSHKFAHHVAGFGGNLTLGFMLGMMPVLGKFLGVPLEVRHITLSTGALTLALCSLGTSALHHGLIQAISGIGLILCLNFGVSFTLALLVALRARGVEHAGRRLIPALAARFLRSPLEFFFPPRAVGHSIAAESTHH
ncbi:MAG: hypothetical protein SFV15_11295 [Polyangiaceae bacterium]|nr:hypothetical protein [Polyangiaceae bacterium]